MKTGKNTTEGDVLAALAKRYKAPEFALFQQLGNATGYGGRSWADAVAMGLWPSRGLYLHGFEVKVSRNDWLRELKDPAKAEAVSGYCDFWWVVAGTKGIVLQGEAPATWGVMELSGRGLCVVKDAPQRHEAKPMDRQIVAAILRRASEGMIPADSVTARLQEARSEGEKWGREGRERSRSMAEHNLENLSRRVEDFENASGVKLEAGHLNGWVGDAYRLALARKQIGMCHELDRAAGHLAGALDLVRKAIEQYGKIERGE